jgi:hypothetical protein
LVWCRACRKAVLPLSFLPTRTVTSGWKPTAPESSMLRNLRTKADFRIIRGPTSLSEPIR